MSKFINEGITIARVVSKIIFPAALLALTVFSQAKPEADVRPLTIGQSIERELKSDEAHSYSLALQAGQFLNVVVEQKGIDVVVTLFDSDNKKVAEVDSPNGTQGAEPLILIVETGGNYRLEVRSPDKAAVAGHYEVKITALRTATEKDKNKIAARQTSAEGDALQAQGTAKALREAIGKYEEVLRLYRAADEPDGDAFTIFKVGSIYSRLGETQKSLEYFLQALQLYRTIGDKQGEAGTLNSIGIAYNYLGDRQKALNYYSQVLPIFRLLNEKRSEGVTLYGIASVYTALGEQQKAFEYYLQALTLFRNIGDKQAEALALGNIAFVYSALGEKQKALEYYSQVLPLFRALKDQQNEAGTLLSIGFVYSALGEHKKHLEYLMQALALFRIVGDKRGEATALNNIGGVYRSLGEPQKALEYHLQVLPLRRAMEDRSGEATSLSNIGNAYFALGDKQKAVDYYSQALPLARAVGNKRVEAATLDNLSGFWNRSNNRRFAIAYNKLSVNNYQQLRGKIIGLDKNVQQSFLKLIEEPYRFLANALLEQNRFAEAQQVLNIFKDQQYFDFNSNKQTALLSLTIHESDFVTALDQKLERIVAMTRLLDDYKLTIGKRDPDTIEASQIQINESNLKAANDDYQALLKISEKDFAAPPTEKDNLPDVADLTQMQFALRETSAATKHKTVAIYQLVGEENFRAIIVTGDSIKSVSVPIKNTVLNEKARQLWALLQSNKYDTTKLSKEIYDVVFKPLEKELPEDTQTIMWSMDGNLRYVPMAALFDGKKFLVERYENVVFTRADQERMTRPVSKIWTGTGFGSTKAQTVQLLESNISFNALPGVTEELREIFKSQNTKAGILDGEVLPDEKFNQAAMLAALRQKRPLVHIASHFSFQPGDEARSFLLLGDGTAYTLEEMKKQTDLLAGVELLTLSACNTAAQQADANGREVDGFAELAQRLGAGAVMATLWSVADNSTPWLMRDFYANRQGGKNGMTKAEALRQAQTALLKGAAKTKPLPAGGKGTTANKLEIVITPDGEKTRDDNAQKRTSVIYLKQTDAPFYKKNAKKPFAHPFFWSPFILIGNWQ